MEVCEGPSRIGYSGSIEKWHKCSMRHYSIIHTFASVAPGSSFIAVPITVLAGLLTDFGVLAGLPVTFCTFFFGDLPGDWSNFRLYLFIKVRQPV